jgi:hypothetical protein
LPPPRVCGPRCRPDPQGRNTVRELSFSVDLDIATAEADVDVD